MRNDPARSSRPTRAVSMAAAGALVLLWAVIRLVVFDSILFPLTYVIPLLVGVWTRDRQALWGMAGAFIVLHLVEVYWLLPDGALQGFARGAAVAATLINIGLGAVLVDFIISLRDRLEASLVQVRAQAEELGSQGEELAQQNEELTHQAETLTQQAEELAQQNEELQTQAEDITVLNEALSRREALLQTLLETARQSAPEGSALQSIVSAALELFETDDAVTAVLERTPEGLCLRAAAAGGGVAHSAINSMHADAFVGFVIEGQQTAALSDSDLRRDLALARLAGFTPRAVLCAPVSFAGETFGALAVYRPHVHEWSDEEFRLAGWLAGQCAGTLQMLRFQQRLRDEDQRKGEFLATLSHELRNPLAPIGFALGVLESAREPKPEVLAVMRRQLRQLVRLVDDLLDATRLTMNKVQIRKVPADLKEIVDHAIQAVGPELERSGHQFSSRLPEGPLHVQCDPDRIAQVVTNLLNNAIRYTPPGGRIALTVAQEDGHAQLHVVDSGIGIDPCNLNRVFDLFAQVQGAGSGGLGIGLALVRGITELHGGTVVARSAGLGRGSEFTVTLPTTPGALPEPPPQPAVEPAPGRRVLLVDDNVDSAEMMCALLESRGHVVRTAHDASQAMRVVSEFDAEVAFLDIGLPGEDGYQLARRLRVEAGLDHIRIIALTGWGADADRARAFAAGFDLHLTKPAEPASIIELVESTPAPRLHRSP